MFKSLRLNLQTIKEHITELDGLRGMAILLVLLYHLFPFIPISKFGWTGVDLFFVLSGFLITRILIKSVNEQRYWRNFIIRRTLRIFPLYYFTLVLYVVICNLSNEFASSKLVSYDFFQENQLWYWLYASNIKTFETGTWLPTIIFNPLWSLSIEEQFYLLWPLVVYSLRGKRLFGITIFLICIVIIVRILLLSKNVSGLSIYVFTFTRLDTILTGSLIAIMIFELNLRHWLERYAMIALGISLFILMAVFLVQRTSSPFNSHIQLYGYTLLAFLFASLLLWIVSENKPSLLKFVFQSNFLVFLGKYSYSLYLFHWPLFRLLRNPLKNFYADWLNLQQTLVIDILASTSVLILTVIASLITWNLFEKRFIALKASLARKEKADPILS
jgi:peptidoglycan/LPS O-acetylase OafA/YrhL